MDKTSGSCLLVGFSLEDEDEDEDEDEAAGGDNEDGDDVMTRKMKRKTSEEVIARMTLEESLSSLRATVQYSPNHCFSFSFSEEMLEAAVANKMNKKMRKSAAVEPSSSSIPNLLSSSLTSSTTALQVDGRFFSHFVGLKCLVVTDKKLVSLINRHLIRWKVSILRKNKKTIEEGASPRGSDERVFKSFFKQELAFRHFDDTMARRRGSSDAMYSPPLKLFTFESLVTGKRQFLVADMQSFYEEYLALNRSQRHVYEIIREDYPCRLYFDLEFSTKRNPDLDGSKLVDEWIQLVSWKLYEVFGIVSGRDSFLDLDSSTTEKFSRHLIVIITNEEQLLNFKNSDKADRTPGILPSVHGKEWLFRNNIEVGKFVSRIVLEELLEDNEATSESIESSKKFQLPHTFQNKLPKKDFEHFFVWNSDGLSRTCFVDLGVYTRNRAFRLLSSCKYGKSACLHVTSHSLPCEQNNSFPQSQFRTNYYIKQLRFSQPESIKKLTTLVLPRTFVVPVGIMSAYLAQSEQSDSSEFHSGSNFSSHFHVIKPMTECASTNSDSSMTRIAPSSLRSIVKTGANTTISVEELACGRNSKSPFPLVDEFITSLVSQCGSRGRISQWVLKAIISTTINAETSEVSGEKCSPNNKNDLEFSKYTLEYQIAGNRFCYFVRREHKSNNVMYVVDLYRGYARQKCWDPDCRGFRSDAFFIPCHLCPSVSQVKETVGDLILAKALQDDPKRF